MKNIVLHFILITLFITSCGGNKESNDLTDTERELLGIIQDMNEKGDGPHNLDSATAEKLKALVKNAAGEWQEIKSEEGNFRIEFPNFKIKEEKTTQILDGDEINIYRYSLNTQHEVHENLGYQVDYTFCPEITTEKQVIEQFNNQRDFVLSATNSSLEYEYVIDTLGYPGRDLYLSIGGSTTKIYHRILFKDGILYKLTVITDGDHLFNKSISKFIQSFKILDQKE